MTREKMRDRGDTGIAHVFLHRRRLSTTWVGGMALVAQSAYSLPMPPPYSVSRCSLGSPVMFRWYGDTPVESGNHLRAATESFLRVIQQTNRLVDGHTEAALVAEFQRRILKAAKGLLEGSKRIKSISLFPQLPLFEIRWQSMTVLEHTPEGTRVPHNLALRMYHSEPSEITGVFIGHLIHEKNTHRDIDPRVIQNERISYAAHLYRIGRHTLWNTVDTSRPSI